MLLSGTPRTQGSSRIGLNPVHQLALIFRRIKSTPRRGDQSVRADAPLFQAADADAMAGASWSCVLSAQRPVVLGMVALNSQIVHHDFEIRKGRHERLCEFGDLSTPHRGGSVVH